jgi:hypothetical protein
MRVMCIRKFIRPSITEDMPPPKMEIGDIFNVLDTYSYCGVSFYKLVEFGFDYGFDTKHFIILSESTADEMQEECKEAIVNIETVLV